MSAVNRSLMATVILYLLAAWISPARADWAACQRKPTRACLLEEALRGDNGPLAGKERLDVLVLTDYRNHPEYLTAADVEEAKRQIASQPALPAASRFTYALLAVKGLVAGKRFQEASDLVTSLENPIRSLAFQQMTRELVRAGAFDRVPGFGSQQSSANNPAGILAETVTNLADMGKIEEALVFMVLNLNTLATDTPQMLEAVGFAYAKRGDPQMAARFYDKAQAATESARRPVDDGSALQFYFAQMSLEAFRGDIKGIKAALKQPPQAWSTSAGRLESYQIQGSRALLVALLQTDHCDVALDVVKLMPDRFRPVNLMTIARQHADKGRLNDARAILSSLPDTVDPKIRSAIQRAIAIATAKSGDVGSAIAMALQMNDPASRRATLFEVAQTLKG
jgi:tetratricopeptide (TPR) repeat protein